MLLLRLNPDGPYSQSLLILMANDGLIKEEWKRSNQVATVEAFLLVFDKKSAKVVKYTAEHDVTLTVSYLHTSL